MGNSAICLNCDGPIVYKGQVWRHMAKTNDGTPILTRWCLDRGWYIWPTMHADPGE